MRVTCDGREAFDDAAEASSFFRRLLGLMGRRAIGDQEALLFRNCPSIHCCFMKMDIDAIYLDEGGAVLHVETLRPWRAGSRVAGCRHVLECGAGVAAGKGISRGSRLGFSDAPAGQRGADRPTPTT